MVRVAIQFEATAVAAGGANDQVSDLNVFWMANNPDGVEPVYATARNGAFDAVQQPTHVLRRSRRQSEHETRFRRYVGDPEQRPLLPQHDLSARSAMLIANRRRPSR